ncbi:extracellular solute-binding protein [Rhizobium mesoamericanum]|uniref:extracellular solute-binding protein n=1 Tax=Rhizobium mesoamericanum TaxID=1079800 RepID=UPI0004116BCD|nr:extracellular solute-binding protein [Rhizobium mesoamericanum]
MTDNNKSDLTTSRRSLLKATVLLALASTSIGTLVIPVPAKAAGKKVIIGAFADGGLTPFKQKIIPLAKEAGFDIDFLEDEYGVTLEKWFADAQNGAGQYDLYLLDDPWVPQFGAANVLEDLGAAGLGVDDKDWIGPLIDMGFWPPRSGPRVAAFKDATPTLICAPFIGDLQTLTYRNDVYTNGAPKTWDEVISKGKEGVASGKIKYPVVFRGVAGNSIVTSWYPIFLSFGGEFFDDKWNPTFNSQAGKAASDFFVGTMKQNAPAGVVEFDSDQEGAAILGGDAGAIIQYSGNALKSDDPAQSKVVGKLDFGVVPKQVKAISQLGIFIAGVPKSAPNKANAIEFLQWYTSADTQAKVAEAGMIPVKRSAFGVAKPGNRLIPVALQQLDAGALPRPRMPEWAKVEELLGIELNKALQAGSGGGAAMDAAANEVKEYLAQAGYYQ